LFALNASSSGLVITDKNIFLLQKYWFSGAMVNRHLFSSISNITIKFDSGFELVDNNSEYFIFMNRVEETSLSTMSSIAAHHYPQLESTLSSFNFHPSPDSKTRKFSFLGPLRLIVVNAGYLIFIIIYIVGLVQEWGPLFIYEFPMAIFIWMLGWLVFGL